MRRLGLRTRFLIACCLLVLTTVSASLWTLAALGRLSVVVGDTVRVSDETTAATAKVASALEREDDALLIALAGDPRALREARRTVDDALIRLEQVLRSISEEQFAAELRSELSAYRAVTDRIVADLPEQDALARYLREANPLLRRAVAVTTRIRDRHFEATRRVATLGRDEAVRAWQIVLVITGVALLVSAGLALHLARLVILPLRALTRRANAIRQGDFEERIAAESGDELGELAEAFNQMAEHLAEFRRSNLGEVLRAKTALEATLEALPDAVILIDPDGQVAFMNEHAAELFRQPDGSLPTDVEEMGIGKVRGAALLEDGSLERGQPYAVDVSRALRVEHGAEPRRFLPRVVRFAGAPTGRQSAVIVLSDVTDLARLDEMRAELIAVASHELRTPVTTLRMSLLMLQETSETLSARQSELVANSLLGVEQLGETVDEFLDLTRIEARQLRLNREPLEVAALAATAIRRAKMRAEEAEIKLEFVSVDGPLKVFGDNARLRAVLDNVLSNALKYTPPGGRICIELRAIDKPPVSGGRSVRIAVTDTGPGIPVEYRTRVFERFFRVEHHRPGLEQGVRGSGIGLYLCREIIELHGGNIRCEAAEDGRGARFVMELPGEGATAQGPEHRG